MFVQLHLDDLVEAAIDGGKTFVHLFTEVADLIVHFVAEAADLIAYVGADVLAFFFDETRKLLELGLFVLRHASQYTIVMRWGTKAMDSEAMRLVGAESAGAGFAWRIGAT